MKTLYIVATPIGNLQDITLRAIETLKKVDLIVCEDTRISSILLSKLKIKKPLLALNEFNEEAIVYKILNELQTKDVALISDAGTPLISDPGFKLIKEARNNGIKLIPIPGASALITALSVSTLATDKFIFLGFLPKATGKAKKNLMQVKLFEATVILYESPHRIIQTLNLLFELFGDIEVCLARELTKIYEEINTFKISDYLKSYNTKRPKGEFVVLFNLKNKQKQARNKQQSTFKRDF